MIRWAMALGVLAGLMGCEGTGVDYGRDADPCAVPPGNSVSYEQCDSTYCVAVCGVLPGDGSPGHRIPDGCLVSIGTSYIHTVTCVETCQECH